ncbi:MAG: hypothetical protein AB7N65_28990 [Vicinamibacterales bacterium]
MRTDSFRSAHVARGLRAVALVALTLVVPQPYATSAQSGSPDQDLERTRQRLEGLFELEEWRADGKVLRPPQVAGRFAIRDGVILFMTVRKDLPVAETVAGYGTYRIDRQGWTYGYTHLETIRAENEGPLTRTVRPPSSSVLTLQWQGDMLIVIGQGTDRREYDRDRFTSQLSGGDYRKWVRIKQVGPQ